MIRNVLSRRIAMVDRAPRLIRDLLVARMLGVAARLWPQSRILALLLLALVLGCLIAAGMSAHLVFRTLQPAAAWPLGPMVAAAFAFIVLLELGAASVLACLRAALRLAYEVGRERIGASLIVLAASAGAAALLGLWADPESLPIPLLCASASILAALALWFQRLYRQPAYRGFRSFDDDIVAARTSLRRAAHDG